MSTIEFVVHGDPVPQGSKIPVVNWKTRKVWLRDDNPHALDAWRKAIGEAARRGRRADWEPLDGPLSAAVVFTLPRPASTPRRRWPHTRPDLDKLLRAVLDALGPKFGAVIADDARIVRLDELSKSYPAGTIGAGPYVLDRPGVWIRVCTLNADQEALAL